MTTTTSSRRLAALCLSLLLPVLTPVAQAANWAVDVAGGKDHPLIQRFTNSWLMAYQQQGFDATTFPGKLGLDSKGNFLVPVAVEGRITRLDYFAPLGKTPLEVHRNYEQALAAAGFKPVLSCTPRIKSCYDMSFGLSDRYSAMKEADFAINQDRYAASAEMYRQMGSLGGINMLGTDDKYFTYGTLSRDDATVHVLLSTGKVYNTDFTATYIEIAEPRAMTGGQVTVNAQALQSGLKNDGRIALYGVYFDTNKAEVKPESKAQLDEIARLLKGQPGMKVILVGHTDNQGALDANLSLSQRRAQAVADALAKGYGIDPSRLLAKGVANLSPVASNSADSGRAKNRRVELVLP